MEITMKGISKAFGSNEVLKGVDLTLKSGEIHALMGENGAGKSTLMKCMFGIYKMDEGEIEYEGEKVTIPTPLDALNRGIAMVHQELQPIPARTVAENIWLGRYPTKSYGPITVVDHPKMYKDTEELLKKLKLDINPHAKLGSLSIAQMQMVEIAKAVSANCKVLILDEPTSSLTANEVESLFRIMRELKALGVALVYISHKMDEIKVIADEVTIMRDGQYIGKWEVADMTKEQIIAKMVGRELSNLFPPLENHPSEEVMMKVEDFTSIHPRSFRHCSFELKKGEILGVAGLVGAQRTELMEGIFGLRAHTSGKVWIKGEEVNIKQPRDAIRKSVALLTEDRRATGIMGVLSVADNISIASLDALRKGPIMLDDKKILDLVATNKEKMAIKVPSPKTQIKSLSGGNQQKVLIARWLANNPDVLILDEPTTGLDPQTRSLLWQAVAGLRQEENLTVFLTTHYMEEAADAGYVVLLDHGRIAAEGTPLQLKNTYAHDTLTLYGVGEADVRRLGLPYAPAEQGWRVTVPDPAAAAELIRREPALFRDFELTKGRMDDVFLAVTGKKLAGGAEK